MALIALTAPARAEDTVPLVQHDCPEHWLEPLQKLLALELHSLVDERPRSRLSDIRAVELDCFADRVVVTVVSAKGRRYRRTLSNLGDEAGAVQPRIVALTAAELADSIWLVAPKSPKEAPSRPYRRIEAAGRRWVLLVGGIGESQGKPSVLGVGAQVAFEHYLLPVLAARLEIRPAFSSAQVEAGTQIRARSLSAVASTLFGDHAWERSQRWSWGFGPGMRIGWAQIIGIPTQPPASCPPPGCDLIGESIDGLWLGPLLTGRVAFLLPEALVFSANIEGGLVVRPLIGTDATGRALFGYDGPWLGGGLAVGSAF